MSVEPVATNFGWPVVILTLLGLAAMVGIGWYSYRRNVGQDMEDFFSASKTMGFVIIALTIFADSYSGNSFLGYSAATYRSGAWFLVYPQFMLAGVIGALLVAPPLINLAKRWNYTSPIDYLEHRYNKRVAFLTTLFLLWGTFVQFLEQFFAMGYLGEIASGGVVPYQYVVVLFAVVILVYVGLGGFRGAALNAAFQGILMLVSLSVMLLLIGVLGGFSPQIDVLWQASPDKLTIPQSEFPYWYSIMILIMFGLPTYIHLQQFYLGVRDAGNLRNTFRLQAPIFLFAAGTLWAIGLFGAGFFPGLSTSESESLVPYLLSGYLQTGGSELIPAVVSLGVVMATLSTAGAAVMVLSMVVSKDMYRRYINPEAAEGRVINASRVALAGFLGLAILVAFRPSLTIWGWTEIKFEFLLQATPALILGFYLPKLKNKPAIAGMIVGSLVAVGLYYANVSLNGVHPGILGAAANTVVFVGGSYLMDAPEEEKKARKILEFNSKEPIDDDDNEYIDYRLPATTKSYWIGLVIVFALIVPWYAPSSWNARAALNLPIWTWVVIGATVLETGFILYATSLWRKKE